MKRVYDYLCGIKGIALILYLQFVISADIFLSVENEKARPLLYLIVFAVLLVACPALMRWVSGLSIRSKPMPDSLKVRCTRFAVIMAVTVAVFGLYYAAYAPGAFSADSINQLNQALSGEYSNWHPVLHTLLFFKLPLVLSGGDAGFIVIYQLAILSFAVSYTVYTILKHSNVVYASLSLVFILINPVTCYVTMYPWKDVAFAITAMLIAAYTANTYFTKGEWLKKPANIAAAVFVLVLATVFRHNALLFTVPMLIAMLIYLKRRAALIVAAVFVAAVVLIEGPIYALMKVEKPGDRQEEMLGVPVAVIGAVAARDPDALSDDAKKFIYEVAPSETWTGQYQIGNFNTVKFFPGTNYHRIEEEGAVKVVGYMLDCLFKSPKESIRALIAATDINYSLGINNASWSDVRPWIVGNENGIVYSGNPQALSAVDFITSRLNTFMNWIFWYVGVMNLLIIAAVLSKLRFRRKQDWKRILPALSMLMYDFGTMLLLSGDEIRMFYFVFTVTPVLLLIVMREDISQPAGSADLIPAEDNAAAAQPAAETEAAP